APSRRVILDPRVELIRDNRAIRSGWVSPTGGPVYQSLENLIHQFFPDALIAPGLVLGATDARFFVDLAECIYHFRPQVGSPDDMDRYHGDNERTPVSDYIRSIMFWKQLLQGINPK